MHSVLPLILLLQVNSGRGQIVLASDGSSIIRIQGLPTEDCNKTVAIYKYSGTPQNRVTLASQVEEALAAIPAAERIKLEAGKLYRYNLQIKLPDYTEINPSLWGQTHGKGTAVVPVYYDSDGILSPSARPQFLRSNNQYTRALDVTRLEGSLKFDEGSSNAYLCIPYREKNRNNTVYTTNIIIPLVVTGSEKSANPAATEPTEKVAATSRGRTPAVKQAAKQLPQPIVGVTAQVQSPGRSIQPDPGLKWKGTGKRLGYTIPCLPEEEEEEPVTDLSLKVYPNPSSGTTSIQYHLPEPDAVAILVYDVQGKAVKTLLSKTSKEAGVHQIFWNSEGLPSGMYLVRVQTSTDFTVNKIMLTRDTHR
ncbi:T9SS type A sorting domain-containing protein [Flavilitoribacter nigricans]|nr:T9SS type A sorting domain-containing protein [Flavilitoribacter nigricans]